MTTPPGYVNPSICILLAAFSFPLSVTCLEFTKLRQAMWPSWTFTIRCRGLCWRRE